MKAITVLLGLFLVIGSNVASAKSYKQPLYKNQIDLVNYRKSIFSRTVEKIVLRCAGTRSDQILGTCFFLETAYQKTKRRGGKVLEEETWGVFPAIEFSTFLEELVEIYDNRFNAGPVIIGTGTGAVFGYALAGKFGAVLGGVLGVPVDIIKLPFSLPYAGWLKLRRNVQKKALRKRFYKLIQNDKYKVTRIESGENFRNLLNKVIEFSSRRVY